MTARDIVGSFLGLFEGIGAEFHLEVSEGGRCFTITTEDGESFKGTDLSALICHATKELAAASSVQGELPLLTLVGRKKALTEELIPVGMCG